MDIEIKIKLNEEEVEEILDEAEDEVDDMIECTKDELNWYKQFYDKYAYKLPGLPADAKFELRERIELGEKILKEQLDKKNINNVLDELLKDIQEVNDSDSFKCPKCSSTTNVNPYKRYGYIECECGNIYKVD